MDFYKHIHSSGSIVKPGLRKTLITERAKETEVLTNLCKSPFQEIQIESGVSILSTDIMF